jgi:hypothetical protein
MVKLIDRKIIMGAAQGALWAGAGIYLTNKSSGYLKDASVTVSEFSSRGPWHNALVEGTTGLLVAGLAGGLLGRKNSAAGKKAGAYMAAGALLTALYTPISSSLEGMMKPGGRMGSGRTRSRVGGRHPTITQALPSTSAAPSTAALRAGGGIVMGAPAVDADQAAYGLGNTRPGGRYINPRYQWSNIRQL